MTLVHLSVCCLATYTNIVSSWPHTKVVMLFDTLQTTKCNFWIVMILSLFPNCHDFIIIPTVDSNFDFLELQRTTITAFTNATVGRLFFSCGTEPAKILILYSQCPQKLCAVLVFGVSWVKQFIYNHGYVFPNCSDHMLC